MPADRNSDQRERLALDRIRDAIRGVRHGTVTIYIQDGVVIQVDRTEKLRLNYTELNTNKDGDGI